MNRILQELSAMSVEELCQSAAELRDRGKGRVVSFSPKVFIPLTQLCRDFCRYCTFRRHPQQGSRLYMTAEEVLETARAGERAGCREALFVLGERPEERYPEARLWLRQQGYDSTVEYLHSMCALVLRETRLYPHSNPGTVSYAEVASLREVNASMGLMLESTSERLCGAMGPHEQAPSKRPELRLRTLEIAASLKVAFTTGLLVGIGETEIERLEAMMVIRDLQRQHGHIQEVIIQNFRAKPETPMGSSTELSLRDTLRTVAAARIVLGEDANIQVPPNLVPGDGGGPESAFLRCGINDWGGISPVTIDYVNPEAPWPAVEQMRQAMALEGFRLSARFPVYPEYLIKRPEFVPAPLLERIRSEMTAAGYIPDKGAALPVPREPGRAAHAHSGLEA